MCESPGWPKNYRGDQAWMFWCFELKIPCPLSLKRIAVHQDQGLTLQKLEDRSPCASHGKLYFDEDFWRVIWLGLGSQLKLRMSSFALQSHLQRNKPLLWGQKWPARNQAMNWPCCMSLMREVMHVQGEALSNSERWVKPGTDSPTCLWLSRDVCLHLG